MTDRPNQYLIRADDDRKLASLLIGDPSCRGVAVRADSGLDVEAVDFGRFAVVLPQLAHSADIRLLEVRPTDESLESVFAYLVGS
jgi:ABC-2 type transport system ATP-binding protein